MATDFQVTIDSADPHAQADWWAEALGWQVEPQDEAFIRRMVDAGQAAESDTTTHRGALVWAVGAAITSPDPGRPRVLFQRVPEARAGKNRLHLDLRGDTFDEAVEAALRLGATPADDVYDGGSWQVLRDPEGNEFCILRPRPR